MDTPERVGRDSSGPWDTSAPPVIPPYAPVMPHDGGSWAVEMPPGVKMYEPEPEPEPEPQPALALAPAPTVAEVLRVRDSVDRVLNAIDAFKEEVALLSQLEGTQGYDSGRDAQLERLQVVGDVLRTDRDAPPATLQKVMAECLSAAAVVMDEVRMSGPPPQMEVSSRAGRGGPQAVDALPTAIGELREFLQQPLGSGGGCFCRLVRSKKDGLYQLFFETEVGGSLRRKGVKETETQLVMSAKKRGRLESAQANYPIQMVFPAAGADGTEGQAIPEGMFLGKVRTWKRGHSYSVFNAGVNATKPSTKHSQRLKTLPPQPNAHDMSTALFEEDRSEVAAIRVARKVRSKSLGKAQPFEVLATTGETQFRPPNKKNRKGDFEDVPAGNVNDATASVIVNGSTFVDGRNVSRKSARPYGGTFKAPPLHKSLLSHRWPKLVGRAGKQDDGSGDEYENDDDNDDDDGAGSDSGSEGVMYLPPADMADGKLPALTARDDLEPGEFQGSARNLVLKNGGGGATQLQMAKLSSDEWLLDFWAPITPLQAFGIALVAFEHTSQRG